MTVTDFERRLLMESANANGMPQGENGDRRLPSQPPPSHPSAQQRIPPFPVMPFPFVPPFFAQTLRGKLIILMLLQVSLRISEAFSTCNVRLECVDKYVKVEIFFPMQCY